MRPTEKLIHAIVSQFRRPRGLGGRLAGREMALRGSNRKRNAWAVGILNVQPTDRVLEIGFGPGIAVRELARRAIRGKVVGIDHSEVMLSQARRRNKDAVLAGRVDLRLGSAESLPAFDELFDKVLTVNSIMFWTEPVERLKELRSVMQPGATIAIVRQPRGPGSRALSKESVAEEIRELRAGAGIAAMRADPRDLKPPVVGVLAGNPPHRVGAQARDVG